MLFSLSGSLFLIGTILWLSVVSLKRQADSSKACITNWTVWDAALSREKRLRDYGPQH